MRRREHFPHTPAEPKQEGTAPQLPGVCLLTSRPRRLSQPQPGEGSLDQRPAAGAPSLASLLKPREEEAQARSHVFREHPQPLTAHRERTVPAPSPAAQAAGEGTRARPEPSPALRQARNLRWPSSCPWEPTPWGRVCVARVWRPLCSWTTPTPGPKHWLVTAEWHGPPWPVT